MIEEKSVPAARDVAALKVPRVGRVQPGPDRSLPWRVVDEHDGEVLEVSDYLRHLSASDFSPASVKSYAGALLRWLRFLHAIGSTGIAAAVSRCATSCCGCGPRPSRRGAASLERRCRAASIGAPASATRVPDMRQRRSTTTWPW
jgi:hypothetical protein